MFKVWIAFVCALTSTCHWVIMFAIGARKNAFTFTFTTGHIKILIVTTVVNSSTLTLAGIMVKVMFRRTVFMTWTFTNTLCIQNLVWWTLCIRRTFTFAVIKILDLRFFAKLKPTITVTSSLVKKLWKVAYLFIWTCTLTEFWFKHSRKLT